MFLNVKFTVLKIVCTANTKFWWWLSWSEKTVHGILSFEKVNSWGKMWLATNVTLCCICICSNRLFQGVKYIKKIVSDHVSVYITELLTIYLALQWIEEKEINNTVIVSDSFSALTSIRSVSSSFRTDTVHQILIRIYRMELKCGLMRVEGKWAGGYSCQQTLRIKHVNLQIPLSKAEAKTFITCTVSMAGVRG